MSLFWIQMEMCDWTDGNILQLFLTSNTSRGLMQGISIKNHVWGNNYPTNLERLIIMQKILIRIITCSPYRAHSEPLFYANKILNMKDINFYVLSVFMHNCVSSPLPGIFTDFYVPNNEFHRHDTRNANDLYDSFARLDIRKFNVRINGLNSWNALPNFVKQSSSISTFKYRLRKHIMSLKCYDENSQT